MNLRVLEGVLAKICLFSWIDTLFRKKTRIIVYIEELESYKLFIIGMNA